MTTCQPELSLDLDVPGICSRRFAWIASLVDAKFSFIVNCRMFLLLVDCFGDFFPVDVIQKALVRGFVPKDAATKALG